MSDAPLVATSSQTIGPFFHFALVDAQLGRLTDRLPGGEPVRLRIVVLDGDGLPVSDALVEISQNGVFGRLPTGEDGACEFETVRGESSGGQEHAPHIDICLFARGLLRQLHTRVYFAGDPALEHDPTLARVPAARRGTLLASPEAAAPGRWGFTLRLQGPAETVFFDV